jgi:hypothetical protein
MKPRTTEYRVTYRRRWTSHHQVRFFQVAGTAQRFIDRLKADHEHPVEWWALDVRTVAPWVETESGGAL